MQNFTTAKSRLTVSASLICFAGVHVVPPLVRIINCSIDNSTKDILVVGYNNQCKIP